RRAVDSQDGWTDSGEGAEDHSGDGSEHDPRFTFAGRKWKYDGGTSRRNFRGPIRDSICPADSSGTRTNVRRCIVSDVRQPASNPMCIPGIGWPASGWSVRNKRIPLSPRLARRQVCGSGSPTQRPRPETKDTNISFGRGGDSFPSGHSIQSWALARVIALEFPDNKAVPILAYSLAST